MASGRVNIDDICRELDSEGLSFVSVPGVVDLPDLAEKVDRALSQRGYLVDIAPDVDVLAISLLVQQVN